MTYDAIEQDLTLIASEGGVLYLITVYNNGAVFNFSSAATNGPYVPQIEVFATAGGTLLDTYTTSNALTVVDSGIAGQVQWVIPSSLLTTAGTFWYVAGLYDLYDNFAVFCQGAINVLN